MRLNPNRLAVYLVALAALSTSLITVLADLDFQSTAGLLGSVAVLGGVVAKWLTGWQQFESALYQSDLITLQHNARTEQAAQVSKPGGRGKSIAVPGGLPR